MREGWKRYKLEELSRRVTVGFVGSMAKEYVESGVPMLRSQNIKPFNLDFNNLKYISEQFHEKIIKSSLKEMDVAIVRTGNPGVAAVIPENLGEVNCSDLVIVTPDQEKINPYFLCYYFNSVAKGYVNSQLVGAVQQHFNVGSAKRMEINLPNMDEQLQIVQVLKSIHDKIELNLQQNQTLEEMAMALYKHWFVDFGPFQEGEFVESELGMIPKGWEVKMIKEVGKVICGKTPSKTKSEYYGGSIPFIKIPNMHNEVFVSNPSEYLSEIGSNSQINKLLPAGAISVSCIATVGKVIITSERCHTNQQINSIVPNNMGIRYYLYFTMLKLSDHFHDLASGGSATLNMNTTTFSKVQILMPSQIISDKFYEKMDPLFNCIFSNQNQNQTLTTLRDTLLPKLISGEIRVKDAQDQLKSIL